MYKRNIAILGPNKLVNSTIGKKLADALAMHYLDTDLYIEYEFDNTEASLIVADYGADFYYALETDKLGGLDLFEDSVIATSSTTVMSEENVRTLEKFCYLVLLSCEQDVALSRMLEDPTMPLKGDIIRRKREYFNNINAHIKPLADIVIDTTVTPYSGAVEKILKKLEEMFK